MKQPEKKLFLLDAMALIYRAHFAFSKIPRINSRGMNTGAILGFTNSLVEILTKEKPTHIAVAFDTSAPTFRHTTFSEYKAQRQEQPEDINIAIPYVKNIVKAFCIPVLELDGYEADDLIGTFAKKACRRGFTVYMMTPDKDFSQLVEKNIFLYKPSYMGNGVDILGVSEVLKKFDIENVDQVRDILGLQGDAVDNIPGIPGIGAKTAVKLLKEFGTIESLVKNVDQLKGKLKENVVSYGEQGILSKVLATINTEVPVEFNEEELEYNGPDDEKLSAIFNELEFRTLMKRVLEGPASKVLKPESQQMSLFQPVETEKAPEETIATIVPAAVDTATEPLQTIHSVIHNYHIVDTPELRKSLAGFLKLQEEICFDTETTGVDSIEDELIGLSFSYLKREAYYVPVPLDKTETCQILMDFKDVLEDEKIKKVGQNLKFDILMLKKYGINIKGSLFDTMVAHYLLEPDMRHKMDLLSESYLNYKPVPIEDLIGKKGKNQDNMKNVDVATVAEYAGEDADITFQLKHKLAPLVREHRLDKLYYELEAPLIQVLAEMEYEGVKVDIDTLKEFSSQLEVDILLLEREIYAIAGEEFNISSPKQLGEILFDKMNLDNKPKKTKTGQYATGEEILSKMASEHTIAKKIIEFRELQKLKNTYVDALPELISDLDGRIHTCYNQAVAATGRLSSTNPNLQNIPIRTEKGREIRKAFIPRNEDFILMAADYSQIELRIMASFARDESMIDAFRNGRDIHSTTASKIFKVSLDDVDSDMRRKAKTANFGIIYGISAFGLSQRLEIPRKEATEIIEAYFQEFPSVRDYMENVIRQAHEKEYVETILGRRRYLRDINSRNATLRGYSERNAINAPIQGSAADMIKKAMIDIQAFIQKENLNSRMILQVHDELVFDVCRGEEEIMSENVERLMKHSLELEVPMEIGIGFGNTWLEAH
ncbi:DNA polymerase I [soil metagenome]